MQACARELVIEMAHRLPNHQGKCRNIHGHSWKINAAVTGIVDGIEGSPTQGMIIDFSDLKIALDKINEWFDHTITLCDLDPLAGVLRRETSNAYEQQRMFWGERFKSNFGWVNVIESPPTSEVLCILWADIVKGWLPDNIHLSIFSVKETASSEAIYQPDDDGDDGE